MKNRWLVIPCLIGIGALATTSPLEAQKKPLSPRDTARGTVKEAMIWIDYSRPYKKGREIFGGLLPYGKRWRAGADVATHLTTDESLVFGKDTLRAGTYTISAIPDKESWTLIINSQTGQWGTEYDQRNDLFRVKMEVQKLENTLEQFVIKIEEEKEGGILKLEWDTTRASVRFTVIK